MTNESESKSKLELVQNYTVEELRKALKLYKEFEGFKKNGLTSIGMTDEPKATGTTYSIEERAEYLDSWNGE